MESPLARPTLLRNDTLPTDTPDPLLKGLGPRSDGYASHERPWEPLNGILETTSSLVSYIEKKINLECFSIHLVNY